MSAIITDSIKRTLLDGILTSVGTTADTYYIGIGRSEQWNDSDVAPNPLNSLSDEKSFRTSLQSIKSAEDVSYVVPRNNWTSGTLYSSFDDAGVSHPIQPYFIITDEQQVYVCVERARNNDGSTKTSTVKPTGQSTSPFATADGYTWLFLYAIPVSRSLKFMSSGFMPVQVVDSDQAAADITDNAQFAVQNAATPGEVLSVIVQNGGSGYTSAPTVVIEGSGNGATALATVNAGQITKVTMVTRGSGYTLGTVSFTGGGGANSIARIVIGQPNGIGSNPVSDLKAKAIVFNTKPDGTETDKFVVGNDFRQIGLLKNPTVPVNVGAGSFKAATGLVLKKLILDNPAQAATFNIDQEVLGATSGSKALVDYIDSDQLWYHQNVNTGFGSFITDVGGNITAPGSTGTLSSIIDSSDIDNLSGDLLYLENRAAVIRSANQTEDIKVIIQL